MAFGNTTRNFAYDHPTSLVRQQAILAANSAGSGSTSGKFYAYTNLIVYGVRFMTTTAGTSTYTVGGTATSGATQAGLLYVTNTATASIALATTTVGTNTAFTIGGVLGTAGGVSGPYALNTLGGTNTTMPWGSATFTATNSLPIGQGGLPMNPGDTLQFVNGTDATAVYIPVIEYVIAPLANVIA